MDKDLKNSIEYLNEKINQTHGFSVPDDYLNNLDDEIFNKISESALPKQYDFNIPDDYFNSLEETIISKINDSNKKEIRVVSLTNRLKKYFPTIVAASIFLCFGLYMFLINTNSLEETITADDIETWFENDFNNTSTYELAELMDKDDFTDEELSLTVNNNELDEYFNTIDNTSLIEELQ